jgi:hypothetical protein
VCAACSVLRCLKDSLRWESVAYHICSNTLFHLAHCSHYVHARRHAGQVDVLQSRMASARAKSGMLLSGNLLANAALIALHLSICLVRMTIDAVSDALNGSCFVFFFSLSTQCFACALQVYAASASRDVGSMHIVSRVLSSEASLQQVGYHQGVMVRVQGLASLMPNATQGQVKLGTVVCRQGRGTSWVFVVLTQGQVRIYLRSHYNKGLPFSRPLGQGASDGQLRGVILGCQRPPAKGREWPLHGPWPIDQAQAWVRLMSLQTCPTHMFAFRGAHGCLPV